MQSWGQSTTQLIQKSLSFKNLINKIQSTRHNIRSNNNTRLMANTWHILETKQSRDRVLTSYNYVFGLSLFCFLSLTLYDILKTHQLDDNIVFMNSLLFLILHLSDRNIPIALANIEMKFICMCQKIPLTMSINCKWFPFVSWTKKCFISKQGSYKLKRQRSKAQLTC